MPRFTLMEEFHLGVYAPPRLTDQEYDAIREALDDPRFVGRLRKVVRELARSYPLLDKVRLRWSR